MRYGVDLLWRKGTGYGSFLIEYHGIKVYFAGDTGYDAELFKKIGRKFPGIDAALLPMAPVHPQSSRVRHTDPHDAVRLFNDLGAKYLIPMHYETFPENFDTLGEVSALLEKEVENGNISREQLIEIPLGGRVILIPSRLR
jgi:L-ascorbate metabolism protein UlaG (beta-lactamase superfamily)